MGLPKLHIFRCGVSPFPHIYVSWSTSKLRVRFGLWFLFKPFSKIFLIDHSKSVLLLWIIYVFSVLCLLCLCARLFIWALWSPTGKGLTSWLSFEVSYCEFVTFPLVSWVRWGTWLYWFLIFAPLLTLVLAQVQMSHELGTHINTKDPGYYVLVLTKVQKKNCGFYLT